MSNFIPRHAVFALLLVCGLAATITPQVSASERFVTNGATVDQRGCYEVLLHMSESVANPFIDVTFTIAFTRPNGSSVNVPGFHDGGTSFRARAYCDQVGTWTWRSSSNRTSLNGRTGSFSVRTATNPGKLRLHPQDRRQFAYDDGSWFLHLGDTGYRYVNPNEPRWQAYIDQAAQMGATKVRTWFNTSRHGVEGLFQSDRSKLTVSIWQEMDRRIRYALEHHPRLNLQLIPYGEDSPEIERYNAGDVNSKRFGAYAQARFSALPNVSWCLTNDRNMGIATLRGGVEKMCTDFKSRELWGTLITNHQIRSSGYAFVNAAWSDIITLETLDEVSGAAIASFRSQGTDPVVLDEDRYETYRPPHHRRYFFRRMVWASLVAGGHATYGGTNSWEAYDGGPLKGVRGYFDACADGTLKNGAHDFPRAQQFFTSQSLNLVGMVPNNALIGGSRARQQAMSNSTTILIYLANPSGTTPETDNESTSTPSVTVALPSGTWSLLWYDPQAGGQGERVYADRSGTVTVNPPGPGDWLLLMRKRTTTPPPPPPPSNDTVYEAESATRVGPVIATNATGYTGSGFADYQAASGEYLQWTVQAAQSGTYRLRLRYALASGSNRPLALSVDGNLVTTWSCPPTGSWNTWGHQDVTTTLSAGTHTVRLASTGQSGPNVDSLTVSLMSTGGAAIQVNFQPASAPTVSGWLVDGGATYGARGNGQTYGWSADIAGTTRDRNHATAGDQLHDTLIHMQKPEAPNARWEIAVPNGTYQVRLVAGDPGYLDSVFRIAVESTLVIAGTPTSTTRWLDQTATIVVSDGRLTVSSASGADNNKLCFIVITPVPASNG